MIEVGVKWNCHKGNAGYEIVERVDGFIDIGSALPYFQEHRDWPPHERDAIQHSHVTVLDVGSGAGRVALYLHQKGHRMVAIDNSPLAVKVSRLRGVKSARALSIRDIQTLRGPFDSVVLYGKNFGLFVFALLEHSVVRPHDGWLRHASPPAHDCTLGDVGCR